MAAALQIITVVATLALAIFLGTIFTDGFFQASIHAQELRGDMPLPYASSILFQNYRALIYVMILPWIAFVGTPVLSRTKGLPENDLFLLRFAAFVAVELLLTVLFLFFLLLPFIPYYALMDMRPNTRLECIATFGFWIILAIMLTLIFYRAVTKSRKTAAKSGKNED